MEKQTTSREVPPAMQLGDETFMSAAELRDYMTTLARAKATKAVNALGQADEAREALIRSLSEPIPITPEKIKDLTTSLILKMRKAAERGETELMVMRFPCALCSDYARALNNAETGWPDTLRGRPRQAFEFWRDHLRPAGFHLKAMVVEWPGGLPGDVGFFLTWGDSSVH
jgi:hypothetical protein